MSSGGQATATLLRSQQLESALDVIARGILESGCYPSWAARPSEFGVSNFHLSSISTVLMTLSTLLNNAGGGVIVAEKGGRSSGDCHQRMDVGDLREYAKHCSKWR